VGLHVAARIVEVVSQMPFDEFLERRIFRPLKMKDTTFFPDADQRARLAKNYRAVKGEMSVEPDPHWMQDCSQPRSPNPSAGLFSTADDVYRFYRMIENGGQLDGTRIVSETAVREMTRVQTGDLEAGFIPGNAWGLGWCIVREPQGVTAALSPGSFGHGGALGTEGWIDPQREMITILLTQRTDLNTGAGSGIWQAFQELAVQTASQQAGPG
jgi:CubicO group peptidase (beta-lactamase class C family)